MAISFVTVVYRTGFTVIFRYGIPIGIHRFGVVSGYWSIVQDRESHESGADIADSDSPFLKIGQSGGRLIGAGCGPGGLGSLVEEWLYYCFSKGKHYPYYYVTRARELCTPENGSKCMLLCRLFSTY